MPRRARHHTPKLPNYPYNAAATGSLKISLSAPFSRFLRLLWLWSQAVGLSGFYSNGMNRLPRSVISMSKASAQ